MQTLLTLEVRWFELGKIPEVIEHWFQTSCPGELSSTVEEREDQYFYTPGCEDLNLKLRQGKLELKWRQTQLEINSFQESYWQGRVERWLKWSYQDSIPENLIQMLGTGDQPIVKIGKKRRQRYYQNVEYELTQLKFDECKFWWSLGFEMEETETHQKTHFENIVSQIIKTYPQTAFNLDHSHAYPSWLLEQVFASHLQDENNFSSLK
ncbi:hypothetical protein M595_3978 [Lyngbya aestuarii BL J]|mgnify:CR=1 FL=1|uniref:CYTH domain protein n=1 Tax=Lyngbya aestuarii BL J TaxID=1348334 RepID=U7QI13_9CYAN|nr:hypothetical protein [Lyngbya aestuarii]ERT06066.1 hypothetical protein M595_3978 [Lyngbya aestuarii BL J]